MIMEIIALSGCSPLGSYTTISSPKSQKSWLKNIFFLKCKDSEKVKVELYTRSELCRRCESHPNRPRVSATTSLIPLLWQNSPNCFCSSRLELVSTTTWTQRKVGLPQTFSPAAKQATETACIQWLLYLELGKVVFSERSSMRRHRNVVVEFSQTRLTHLCSVLSQVLLTKVKLTRETQH